MVIVSSVVVVVVSNNFMLLIFGGHVIGFILLFILIKGIIGIRVDEFFCVENGINIGLKLHVFRSEIMAANIVKGRQDTIRVDEAEVSVTRFGEVNENNGLFR